MPPLALKHLERELVALRAERDALAEANVRAAELMAELAEARALEVELRRRSEEQGLQLDLAAVISAARSPEDLLSGALEVLVRASGVDVRGGAAYLHDPDPRVLRRVAGEGPDAIAAAGSADSPVQLDGERATLWIFGHGRCTGALHLRVPGSLGWRDRWLRVLDGVAAQLAVALDRALFARENLTITTELIKARDRAEQANSAKTRFLANVSHELRTPINAIVGYTELLEELCEESGDREYLEDLRKIRTASSHLLGLIGGLLDLTQIEMGRLSLRPTRLSISTLVGELRDIVTPLAVTRGNHLAIVADEAPEDLIVDPRALRQCLVNLLDNACKYTDRGRVTLRIGAADERVTFTVEDTGIGIAPEQQRLIFDVFVRAEDPAVLRRGGSGIGLAITHGLVAAMGGELTVSSTPGQGSTFAFSLPRAGT